MSTRDEVARDLPDVTIGRRASAGVLDAAGAAATCLMLLDLALTFGASWPIAMGLAAIGPTLSWGLLESRGPGTIGRFAAGLALRNLDGSRLSIARAVLRQAPIGLLVCAGVLFAPGFALIALALGAVDLLAGKRQPLHRTLRDRWFATIVVSRRTAAASERVAGYAYLESGAPMRYRGEA